MRIFYEYLDQLLSPIISVIKCDRDKLIVFGKNKGFYENELWHKIGTKEDLKMAKTNVSRQVKVPYHIQVLCFPHFWQMA